MGKKIRVILCLVLCVTGVSQASFCLSGNNTATSPTWTVPGSIDTGATYQWITSSSLRERGATDSAIVAGDEQDGLGYWDMQDGVGSDQGGEYAIWGSYSANGVAAVGTCEFDLKDIYLVDEIQVMATFNGNNQGVGRLEAWTSLDGVNYSLFGVWDDPTPANGLATLSIAEEAVEARYVQIFMDRDGTWSAYPANYGHTWHRQMLLSEMMVLGNTIPEPATVALLAIGSLGFLRKR